MRNIKLVLEYDGTAYTGWQIQSTLPTVQGELAKAIKTLTNVETRIVGASRTDAGVHAMAQVANFRTDFDMPVNKMEVSLNFFLPPDIAIKEATDMPEDFDARRDSKAKTYLYRVYNGKHRSAVMRNLCWSVHYPLDVEVMKKGAEFFIGEKDFSSFRSAECEANHPVREISSFTVERADNDFIEFRVKGTAFLRHMVRILAGTIVTLGRGKITLADIPRIIEARDRRKASLTAPPQGLFLKEVEY